MIQQIADTINGWAAALQSLAARIQRLSTAVAPDFSPITEAVANAQAGLDAVRAAVAAKETPSA
ncbi:MAG: hypothetical protein JO290_06375 [Sphingomonadaceae bacterium]|nr:hypothetical protein [Sphingomonadaceae bacterium]